MSGAAVTARLVEYEPGRYAAFAPGATLELVEHPRPLPVPGGAACGHGLLEWQGLRIPMIDLAALVRGPAAQPLTDARYALVLRYRVQGGLAHGAIGLSALPVMLDVGDPPACALPEGNSLWAQISLSCFVYQDHPVPVVDAARLFTRHAWQ